MKVFLNILVFLSIFSKAIFCARIDGGRIVGGIQVSILDYPYQLSLRVQGRHVCGASVINENFAVTAAHCVSGIQFTTITLLAGNSDRTGTATIYSVSQVNSHALYNPSTLDYDIALLKTSQPMRGTGIQPIRLAAANMPLPPGLNSTTSGWGTMSLGATTLPIMLRAVSIPVTSDAECKASYGSSIITNRMFCAGFTLGGKDSCQGDSGGPLVATIGGVNQLIGIVSWGYGCAMPHYPGIYTKISAVRSWIAVISNV